MQPSVHNDTRFTLGGQSFVWNNQKATDNIKKHNIHFEEAASVFLDLRTIYVGDEEHSFDEERSVAIGFSKKARILMVCHCLRENGETIRIISARKAVQSEIDDWEVENSESGI